MWGPIIALLALFFTTPCVVLASLSEPIQECAVRFQDNGVCACSTYPPEGPVKCQNGSNIIEVQPCFCVYYNRHLNTTEVGSCFYTCYQHSSTVLEVTNSTSFNDDFCDSHLRRGFFCYECNQTLAMGVLSSLLIDCVECHDYGYKNWLKYFAITLLPLTLFYMLAVLLSFNITSSSLSGIVLVIQCITFSPVRTNFFEGFPDDRAYDVYIRTVMSLFEVASLEFDFYDLLNPFCLHPKLNVFAILCLKYVTVVYPFLLIFLTYALITAYDKEYKVLVWMWKPFKACLFRFRKTWNIRTSLVEIFATFIILSSIMALRVSFRILACVATYDVAGNRLNYVASMSANVKYFSSQHLPYALLAIAFGVVFAVFPLLLVIYPCKCFQKCLNCCGLRLQILHTFMDAFQGSYKTSPRDMRYFSALYMLLRFIMLAHAVIHPSPQTLYISGCLSLVTAAIITLFQPYKVSAHNAIDSILLLLMGVYFISCNEAFLLASLHYGPQWTFASVLQVISLLPILLYLFLLLIWKLLQSKILALLKAVKVKLNCTSRSTSEENGNGAMESFERDLQSSSSRSYSPLTGHSQSLLSTY